MIHANVLVVMGSIRAGRRCPQIAAWVVGLARAASTLEYELVDLGDWPLPMDDEPGIPARGDYLQPHTRAWSRKIAAADAVVFVTPQYNWGYPAALKNAIDHAYSEWHGKPAAIITYGGHGGTKCAAQLRQVTEALHMHTVATMPAITLTHAMIGGDAMDLDNDFNAAADLIRQAIGELSAALAQGAP
jgi:NAD(P)H-dependent FMN reductase